MGIMVYSLLWIMQDFVHQPNYSASQCGKRVRFDSNIGMSLAKKIWHELETASHDDSLRE